MPELLAISVTSKDYRKGTGRTVRKGFSVPLMMEEAMKGSLGSVLAGVKRQLPGKRLKTTTKLLYNRTPQGATARLVVGEGVPFAYVQAKYGKSPTTILPRAMKHLAIPRNAAARKMQENAGAVGLMSYPELKKKWIGRGKYVHMLFRGSTPMFNLVHQAIVKPSVDLNEVRDNMRMAISTAFKGAFAGFDFGYLSMRKGS